MRLIGEGGFGKVYEVARDRYGIEERSAMKVVSIPTTPSEAGSLRNEGLSENDITNYYKGLVQDFVQEIAMMKTLRGNPYIVGYEDYEVVEHTDRFGWDIYIRMELLTPLTACLTGDSLPEADVVNISIDICKALEECFAHQIVHRDIKPDNIFISGKGEYKLGDFGVAKTVEKAVTGLSKKGTYTYMAPELYKGEPVSMNCDLYSLGMVIYRLLNNEREPFTPPAPQPIGYKEKQEAIVRRMNGEAFPPPASGSKEIFDIIKKACAYDSAQRYQTPTQMRKDLEALRNGTYAIAAPPAPPVPPVPPAPQPPKKKSRAGLIVALVLAALLTVGGIVAAVLLLGDDNASSNNRRDDDEDETSVTEETTVDDVTVTTDTVMTTTPTTAPPVQETPCADCKTPLSDYEQQGLYNGYCSECYYKRYCWSFDGNVVYKDGYCADCYASRQATALIGTWSSIETYEVTDDNGAVHEVALEYTSVFSEDGKYALYLTNTANGATESENGSYTVENNRIIYDGDAYDVFEISGDTLTIFLEDGDRLLLQRVE